MRRKNWRRLGLPLPQAEVPLGSLSLPGAPNSHCPMGGLFSWSPVHRVEWSFSTVTQSSRHPLLPQGRVCIAAGLCYGALISSATFGKSRGSSGWENQKGCVAVCSLPIPNPLSKSGCIQFYNPDPTDTSYNPYNQNSYFILLSSSNRKLSIPTAWKKPTLLSSRNERYSWVISQCSQWVLDQISFCTFYYLSLNSWSAQEIYCSIYCVSNGVCSSKQGWLTCPCIAWGSLAVSWC